MCATKVKDINWIKEVFGLEGYALLTKEYKNQQSNLEYICPNGHKRSTTWKQWQRGNRCLVCKNQKTKLSIEEIRPSFSKEGYTLVSTEYVNNKTKLYYICSKGHKNSISWGGWKAGCRCPDCANNKKLTLEKVIKDFEKEGYVFLGGDYKNNTSKLVVRCSRGHEFLINRVGWTSGSRCPICYKERINLDIVSKSFRVNGYTLLANKYVDAHTKG